MNLQLGGIQKTALLALAMSRSDPAVGVSALSP